MLEPDYYYKTPNTLYHGNFSKGAEEGWKNGSYIQVRPDSEYYWSFVDTSTMESYSFNCIKVSFAYAVLMGWDS